MASSSGIAGYTENLSALVSVFRAERDRIDRDYRLPAEGKEIVTREARDKFTEQAVGLVHHVLGKPGMGGLAGGVLWERMNEAQAELRRAYDAVDADTDFARLSYERAKLPETLARFANAAELEEALPRLGAYTRRAMADASEVVHGRFPGEVVGGLLAGLRRERDAATEAATARQRAQAESIVGDGVKFVEAARGAALESDTDERHLGDVLQHVAVEELVDPRPGGGVRYRLSRREATPIDVNIMQFGDNG